MLKGKKLSIKNSISGKTMFKRKSNGAGATRVTCKRINMDPYTSHHIQ